MEFILNDESVVNSYGFRTLNAGISLDRFNTNPVALYSHDSNKIIGRWLNLRVEGPKLIADLEIDEQDEFAMDIKGKIERGFLKGASMGILPAPDAFEYDGFTYVLKACEMIESSVTPIPSNKGAIVLYNQEGIALSLEETTLQLSTQLKPNTTMKFNQSTLALLALSSDATPEMVEQKVVALATENASLREILDAQQRLSATTRVDEVIAKGKASAEAREELITLALEKPTVFEKVFNAIPDKVSLSTSISNPTSKGVTTKEDFLKLSTQEKVEFKNAFPDQYTALFKIN